MATQQERTTATRQALIDAAAALFAESGFKGTSVAAIGERAGVSPGSIFWHFESKQGLLMAVVDQLFGGWASGQMLDDVGDATGLDALSRAIWSHHGFLQTEPHLLRLYYVLLFEGLGSRSQTQAVFVAIHRRFYRHNESYLAEAAESGELRPGVDLAATAAALEAALGGMAYHWLADPEEIDLERSYRSFVDLVMSGLRRSC